MGYSLTARTAVPRLLDSKQKIYYTYDSRRNQEIDPAKFTIDQRNKRRQQQKHRLHSPHLSQYIPYHLRIHNCFYVSPMQVCL